jgi:hypothetical protein
MRGEGEIRGLMEELSRLTGFIAEFGEPEQFQSDAVTFSGNACDALCWVLEELGEEELRSEDYLNIVELRRLASNIERRTGKSLEDYH